MKNILEYFENTVEKYPNKISFIDPNEKKTFLETQINAKSIASFITKYGSKKATLIVMEKTCRCIESMIGVLYADDYYIVADIHSPVDRIKKIYDILNPSIIITDSESLELSKTITKDGNILLYEQIVDTKINEEELTIIRENSIDLDIAYILFTSGSTGIPKGTIINHRSLISYIDWVTNQFKFDDKTVFGSQTPLYFSMSVTDFYSTLKCGCTYCIIPKQLFMFPIKLVEYMNEKLINTIYWVPTAISILSNWKVLDYIKPKHLNKVLFAGEVMPTKQLNYWINSLEPNVTYANLFGPTETTDICTFYVIDRKFNDNESLPIGKHCDNCDVFVVKEDGTVANVGEEGEMYVKSSFMACGYYNNSEKTQAAFVQNPLNKMYPDIVYKTGDIVKISENGELLYISRADFQIKRNGYRIELGEIENNANAVEGVKSCACIYIKEKEEIILYYDGGPKDESIMYENIKKSVPNYMIPDKVIRIKEMPKNANGKIDRKELINKYK